MSHSKPPRITGLPGTTGRTPSPRDCLTAATQAVAKLQRMQTLMDLQHTLRDQLHLSSAKGRPSPKAAQGCCKGLGGTGGKGRQVPSKSKGNKCSYEGISWKGKSGSKFNGEGKFAKEPNSKWSAHPKNGHARTASTERPACPELQATEPLIDIRNTRREPSGSKTSHSCGICWYAF